jgi:subtilisin family serine protease
MIIAVLLSLISVISAVPLYQAPNDTRIEGKYIIAYKNSASDDAIESYIQYTAKSNIPTRPFNIGDRFKGVFATLTQNQLMKHLDLDEVLDFIEEDQVVSISQSCSSTSTSNWGLARISEKKLGSLKTYHYISGGGGGVTSYIIDTGIRTTHSQFSGGRAVWGYNAVDSQNTDCNGHGTHVASSVAGNTVGVAKSARVVAVKVLNCAGSGSNSGVISGIEWVQKNKVDPANANLSLGGGYSTAVNNAVNALSKDGVVVVVAAGNDNANACNYSPASATEAVTVGATTSTDTRSSFSNYGTCVNIFGPGSSIYGAWYTSDTAYNTISGTSMASPHVAGLVSLIQGIHGKVDSKQALQYLDSHAVHGALSNVGTGSPNILGHVIQCGVN